MATTITKQGWLSLFNLGTNSYVIKDKEGRELFSLNKQESDAAVGGYFLKEDPITCTVTLYKKTAIGNIETQIDKELTALYDLMQSAIISSTEYQGIIDITQNTLTEGDTKTTIILTDRTLDKAKKGDIVLQKLTTKEYQQEFIFNGTTWNEFGAGGSLGAFAFADQGIVTIVVPTIKKGSKTNVSVSGKISVEGIVEQDAPVTGKIAINGVDSPKSIVGENVYRYTPRFNFEAGNAAITSAGTTEKKTLGTEVTQAASSLTGDYIPDEESLTLKLSVGAVTLKTTDITYKTGDPTITYTAPTLTGLSTDFTATLNTDAKAAIKTKVTSTNDNIILSSSKTYLEDITIGTETKTPAVTPVTK